MDDPFASRRKRHLELRDRGAERPSLEQLAARYFALRASGGPSPWDSATGAELRSALAGTVVRAGPSGAYVFAGADSIARLWDVADHVAYGDENFLVLGERGAGKEAIAHLVAEAAGASAVVTFNCATLVETLAVGQLFGVAAGAASGVAPKRGLVKRAEGGVLFLDEFFAAPPTMFPQLLRLLEQRTYSQVGREEDEQPFVGWIVAASNRFPTEDDLEAAVERGTIPGDLVDRFTARIWVPPLRLRRAEIPAIADNVLRGMFDSRRGTFPFVGLDGATAAALSTASHDWPGNIRELKRLLMTEARVRRHAGASRDRLHVPRDELERALGARVERDVSAPGAIGPAAPPAREVVSAGRRRTESPVSSAADSTPPSSSVDAPPGAPAVPRLATGPGSLANPFDRTELREHRLRAVVAALESRLEREGRVAVDARWVGDACAAEWGVRRAVGQKLKRTIGLDCTALAALLSDPSAARRRGHLPGVPGKGRLADTASRPRREGPPPARSRASRSPTRP